MSTFTRTASGAVKIVDDAGSTRYITTPTNTKIQVKRTTNVLIRFDDGDFMTFPAASVTDINGAFSGTAAQAALKLADDVFLV